MNRVARMVAIQRIVAAAFSASGSRKAGTPLEIASTPVSAVHPEAKARRTRNQVRAVVAGGGTEASGGTSPRTRRRTPAPTRTTKVAMKR